MRLLIKLTKISNPENTAIISKHNAYYRVLSDLNGGKEEFFRELHNAIKYLIDNDYSIDYDNFKLP